MFIMAQATVVGLYSGNVVTIIHPSSTINCWTCPYTAIGVTMGPTPVVDSSMNIVINSCATYLLSGHVEFDISGSAPPSVKVTVGQFVAQVPVPIGYVGPVIVPFQTAVFCPTTVTLVASASASTIIRVTYSTLQLG
jgi:hypothetical protein